MFDFDLSLTGNLALIAGAGVGIAISGIYASKFADQVADRTGLGEALTGTIFLGFLTALPGLVASVVAAAKGRPAMAISNAMGGIAVQTAALAVADMAYRKANLEHAAASVPNMMQATMLVLLVTLVLLGLSGPAVTVGHVHPATIILIIAAIGAFVLVVKVRRLPMWEPRQTDQTVADEPNPKHERANLTKLIVGLVAAALFTAACGGLVAEGSENLVDLTGIPETVIGALVMAIATSLPELVTSVAAVRQGALTLAVSDIVGGNFFDVLFVAAADIAYFEGSIYHAEVVGSREVFITALTILLNVVLLSGLICRQKTGPANIGFESASMLLFYVGGLLVLSLAM